MAGKRGLKNQDSTGLLLDTVTNAFGGIILIALLIALTASSRIDGLKREADQARNETRARAVAEAKKTLQDLIKILEGKEVSEAVAKGIERLKGLLGQHERRGSLIEERDRQKDVVADQERQIENQRRQAQFAVHDLRLPAQKVSSMTPIPIIIRNGKAFPCLKVGDKGKLEINKAAVKFSRGKSGAKAEIVDSGGLLDDNALAAYLSGLDSSKHYPTYVVYEDSFEKFDEFKRITTSKNFYFAWMPKLDSEDVEMGKSGKKLPVE
jgi:hypothetical protein